MTALLSTLESIKIRSTEERGLRGVQGHFKTSIKLQMLLLEVQLQQIFMIIRKGYKYNSVSFNKNLVQEKIKQAFIIVTAEIQLVSKVQRH